MLFVRLKKKNIENLLTTITCVTGIWKYRDFFGGGKPDRGVPGEKPLGARQRTSNKLSPHMESTLGFEPGPHL